MPAYLVVPAGKGPFAAILFGHWAMDGSPTRNRTEFLEEAVALVVVLQKIFWVQLVVAKNGPPPQYLV